MTSPKTLFKGYALGVGVFCLLVILWGTWVRISHSGEGCGQSWPSCKGEYLLPPQALKGALAVEWIHRTSSGLFALAVVVLTIWAMRGFAPSHPVRKMIPYPLILTIMEALIGAGLVLGGLTGRETSVGRGAFMGFHLINSLLLLSSLFVLWRLALGKTYPSFRQIFKKNFWVLVSFAGLMFLGAFSSLASTLFPSPSLMEGLNKDLHSQAPLLLQLRILHPLLALIFISVVFLKGFNSSKVSSRITGWLAGVLVSGLVNLIFLSPVILKLTHLLMVCGLIFTWIISQENSEKP